MNAVCLISGAANTQDLVLVVGGGRRLGIDLDILRSAVDNHHATLHRLATGWLRLWEWCDTHIEGEESPK